ncbi:MAG: hypothetical protein MJB57_14315 [Gemmatimonadetes bacterium]|nr:hypothetical protein [Gemmatimonadota bacterium]
MPLTDFQREILGLVARTRSPDSYLAGGAALHLSPKSTRYSEDLDFFHDSSERVASAYSEDAALLEDAGCTLEILISQPGFIRVAVRRDDDTCRIDWAHESAWRFLPVVRDSIGGYLLHEVDLAINKTLALAGRDEPRDFIDILFVDDNVLPLAGLVWAAVGKDPGFTPLSLLELLKRRGRHRPEDLDRLWLTEPFDAATAKVAWLTALERAKEFVRSRPPDEIGCLYYFTSQERFVIPRDGTSLEDQGIDLHFGSPGGVLPQIADG